MNIAIMNKLIITFMSAKENDKIFIAGFEQSPNFVDSSLFLKSSKEVMLLKLVSGTHVDDGFHHDFSTPE